LGTLKILKAHLKYGQRGGKYQSLAKELELLAILRAPQSLFALRLIWQLKAFAFGRRDFAILACWIIEAAKCRQKYMQLDGPLAAKNGEKTIKNRQTLKVKIGFGRAIQWVG